MNLNVNLTKEQYDTLYGILEGVVEDGTVALKQNDELAMPEWMTQSYEAEVDVCQTLIEVMKHDI